MDGARTSVDKAPVVVGVPEYGPCEVTSVTGSSGGVVAAADKKVVVVVETTGTATTWATSDSSAAAAEILNLAIHTFCWLTDR